MGAPELAVGRGARPAALVGLGDFQGALDVAEDDLPRLGAAVVGLGLVRLQVVDERPVVDAVVGDGPGEVEPHRLEVLRDQLHRRDAARADLLDERLDGGERGPPAPEPEAGGVGEVGDLGGARRAGVDNARARKPVLQLDHRERPLGRFADASGARGVEGGTGVVRFIIDDHPLEVGLFTAPRQPGDDLFQPIDARLHAVPLSRLAFERVVAREADALGALDRPLAGAEVEHEVGRAAQGGPVADGVAHEAPVLGHPEGSAAALEHVVEDDRRRLPPLPHSGPVAEEEPLARPGLLACARQLLVVRRARPDDGLDLGVGEMPSDHEVLRKHRTVVTRRRRGRRHRGRLDEARRVRARAGDPDAGPVGVEHGRRERARLGAVPSGLDRQRESVREGPRRHGLPPRGHLHVRARRGRAQTGYPGREESEEVELLDRGLSCGLGRLGRERGHRRVRLETKAEPLKALGPGLRPTALAGSPTGPRARGAIPLASCPVFSPSFCVPPPPTGVPTS